MKLLHTVVLVGLVSLAAACQGTPVTQSPVSGGENDSASSTTPAPTAVVEQSGFGGSGDYLWITSTVRDVPVGQFATVSFNLYGADGTLLATESQVEQGVNAGARTIIGTQVNAPQGGRVTRIEPTLKVSDNPAELPNTATWCCSSGQSASGKTNSAALPPWPN